MTGESTVRPAGVPPVDAGARPAAGARVHAAAGAVAVRVPQRAVQGALVRPPRLHARDLRPDPRQVGAVGQLETGSLSTPHVSGMQIKDYDYLSKVFEKWEKVHHA